MTAGLCFIFLFVSSVLCGEKTEIPPIDADTLENVFGNPQFEKAGSFPASLPAAVNGFAQALPVTDEEAEATNVVQEPRFKLSSEQYDHFDLMLTKRVAASSDENFLLSPLGLKLALAILTEAATGSTRSQLASVLGNEPNTTLARAKYSAILESLHTKSSAYILNLGSRIYLEEDVHPQQRFAAVAELFYKTELVNADFANPPLAAQQINSWVANVTAGRISALVNEEDVTGIVAMVLTTLYYKGNWTHQFPLTSTKPGRFFVSAKKQQDVFFMNTKDKFYYAESRQYDAKILRLPYLGDKFSMYIIVPNSLTGLGHVCNSMSVANIRTELQFLQQRLVDVTLPKFHFDYTSVLDNVLQEMGIRSAFEDVASFPGLARGQALRHRMKISHVLQRSGIEVNEVGSVAFSATEISLVNKFGDDDEISEEVVANRPFLFFIQDDATNQLLFTGRVSNPAVVDGAFKLQ